MRAKILKPAIILGIMGIVLFLPIGRYKSYINMSDGSMVSVHTRFGIWATVTYGDAAVTVNLKELDAITQDNNYLIYSLGGSSLSGSWDSWGDGQKYLNEIMAISSMLQVNEKDDRFKSELREKISGVRRHYMENSEVFSLIDDSGRAIPFQGSMN